VIFFAISGWDAHLNSEFSPKLLEIDQDNLHMTLNDAVARLMSIS